jgi:hypothetical protein
MTALEWILAITLFFLYLLCLSAVCGLTFSKGYTACGIIGIFIPFLWLIGAILPAKPVSRFAVAQVAQYQHQLNRMTG